MGTNSNSENTDSLHLTAQEPGDLLDAPQLKLTSEPKPMPKPGSELGNALNNILGQSFSKQHSPMDKK